MWGKCHGKLYFSLDIFKLRWIKFSLGNLPREKTFTILNLSFLGKTVNKSSLPRAKVRSVTTAIVYQNRRIPKFPYLNY